MQTPDDFDRGAEDSMQGIVDLIQNQYMKIIASYVSFPVSLTKN